MELREYVDILRRRWLLILGSVVIFAGGMAMLAASQPVSFNALTTVSFIKNAQPAAESEYNYRYDDFYALQASGLLAEMATGWLADPSVVTDLYLRAQVPVPGDLYDQYDQVIKIKRVSPSVVQIIANADTADNASKIAVATTNFIKERIRLLVQNSVLNEVEILDSAPLSVQKNPGTLLFSIIGVILGKVVGILLAFFAEGMKPKRS